MQAQDDAERGAGSFHRADKPKPHQPGEMFRRLDKDKDGVISLEEFAASPRISTLEKEKQEILFTRLDENGNGKLSPKEIHLNKKSDEARRKEFRELDTDDSRGLSFEEMSKGEFFSRLPEEKRREIFARMDTNGDGEVNRKDKPERPGLRGGKREPREEE